MVQLAAILQLSCLARGQSHPDHSRWPGSQALPAVHNKAVPARADPSQQGKWTYRHPADPREAVLPTLT